MGYAKPSGPQPAKSAIKSVGGDGDHDEQVEEGGGPDKAKKVGKELILNLTSP